MYTSTTSKSPAITPTGVRKYEFQGQADDFRRALGPSQTPAHNGRKSLPLPETNTMRPQRRRAYDSQGRLRPRTLPVQATRDPRVIRRRRGQWVQRNSFSASGYEWSQPRSPPSHEHDSQADAYLGYQRSPQPTYAPSDYIGRSARLGRAMAQRQAPLNATLYDPRRENNLSEARVAKTEPRPEAKATTQPSAVQGKPSLFAFPEQSAPYTGAVSLKAGGEARAEVEVKSPPTNKRPGHT